jgi:hypothetical protein
LAQLASMILKKFPDAPGRFNTSRVYVWQVRELGHQV